MSRLAFFPFPLSFKIHSFCRDVALLLSWEFVASSENLNTIKSGIDSSIYTNRFLQRSVSVGNKKVMFGLLAFLPCLTIPEETKAADYTLDPAHTSVAFKVKHIGLSWTFGRFNDVQGEFSFDENDLSSANFKLIIKTESIDTGNKKRDDHLRSPDFFHAEQFPLITFESKSVKPSQKGYEVTGDFTLHGITKPITLKMTGGKMAEFPKGVQRIGFTSTVGIKRSDYGMTKLVGPVGDEVYIAVSFEGTLKK